MTSPGVCVPKFHEIVADLIAFKKKGLTGKILNFFQQIVTDLIAFKKKGEKGKRLEPFFINLLLLKRRGRDFNPFSDEHL